MTSEQNARRLQMKPPNLSTSGMVIASLDGFQPHQRVLVEGGPAGRSRSTCKIARVDENGSLDAAIRLPAGVQDGRWDFTASPLPRGRAVASSLTIQPAPQPSEDGG